MTWWTAVAACFSLYLTRHLATPHVSYDATHVLQGQQGAADVHLQSPGLAHVLAGPDGTTRAASATAHPQLSPRQQVGTVGSPAAWCTCAVGVNVVVLSGWSTLLWHSCPDAASADGCVCADQEGA